MATNTQKIGVTLSFNADTSKAKQQLRDLQNTLSNLTSSATYNKEIDLGLSGQLTDSVMKANELKSILANATLPNGNLDLSKFNIGLKQAGLDAKTLKQSLLSLGPEGANAFQQLTQSVMNAEVPIKRMSTMLDKFSDTLKRTVSWQISSSLIHGTIGSIQKAFSYSLKLNESLNKIRIVTGQSANQMADFAKEANKAAKELNTTTTAYTDASLIFYQQGLTGEAVKERTDVVIKMANVTGQSASEVSSYMTAIWNNFDDGSKSLEHYADVITALGAATASSSEEIAEGLEKFAAIGNTVGLSYEYATTALATVVAQTRQSADTVGTAFKTLFARIQDLELGDTLEDGTTLGKYSQALQTIGVNIKDATGQAKDMDQILEEMGSKWETIDKNTQIAVAQAVAGTRQYSQLVALMDNWDVFRNNLSVANNASGSLKSQAEIYEESWVAAKKNVQSALESLYSEFLNGDTMASATKGLATIIELITSFVQSLGGVRTLLIGIVPLITKLFGPEISNGLSNIIYNFQTFRKKGQAQLAETRAAFAQEYLQLTEDMKKVNPSAAFNFSINETISQEYLKTMQKFRDVGAEVSSEFQTLYKTQTATLEILQQQNSELEKQKEEVNKNTSEASKTRKTFTENYFGDEENKRQANSASEQYAQSMVNSVVLQEMSNSVKNVNNDETGLNELQAKLKSIIPEGQKDFFKELLDVKSVDDFKTKIEELGEAISRIQSETQQSIKEAVGKEFEKSIKDIDKEIEKNKEAIKKFKESLERKTEGSKGYNKTAADIDRLQKRNKALEDQKKANQKTQNKAADIAAQEGEALAAQKRHQLDILNNERAQERIQKNILNQLKQQKVGFQQISTGVQNLVKGVGSVSMAASSLFGMRDSIAAIFSDDTEDRAQKIFGLFSSLPITLSMTINGFNTLKTGLLQVTGATELYNAQQELNVATTAKDNAVKELQIIKAEEYNRIMAIINAQNLQQIERELEVAQAELKESGATDELTAKIKALTAAKMELNAQNAAQSASSAASGFAKTAVSAISKFAGPAMIAATVGGLAFSAISGIIKSIKEREIKKLQGEADKESKTLESTNKTREGLQELVKTYKQLDEQQKNGEITSNEVREKVYDLCKQYNLENEAIKTLTSSYGNLNNVLEESLKKVNESTIASVDRTTGANEEVLKKKLGSSTYNTYIKKNGGLSGVATNWDELQVTLASKLSSDDFDAVRGLIEDQQKRNLQKTNAIMSGIEKNVTGQAGYNKIVDEVAKKLTDENLATDSKNANEKVRDYFVGLGSEYASYAKIGYAQGILENLNVDSNTRARLTEAQAQWIIDLPDLENVDEYSKQTYGKFITDILNNNEEFFTAYGKVASGDVILNAISNINEKNKLTDAEIENLFKNSNIGNIIDKEIFKNLRTEDQLAKLQEYYSHFLRDFDEIQEEAIDGITKVNEKVNNELASKNNFNTNDIVSSVLGFEDTGSDIQDVKNFTISNEKDGKDYNKILVKYKDIISEFKNASIENRAVSAEIYKQLEDAYKNAEKNSDDAQLLYILMQGLYGNEDDDKVNTFRENSLAKAFINNIDISDDGEKIVSAYGKILGEISSTTLKTKNTIENTNVAASIAEFTKDLTKVEDKLKSVSSAYNTLSSAVSEYNQKGYMSLDNLMSLVNMNPEYLSALEFDGKQMKINTDVLANQIKMQLYKAKADVYEKGMAALKTAENAKAAEVGDYATATNLRLASSTYTSAAAAAAAAEDWDTYTKSLKNKNLVQEEIIRQTETVAGGIQSEIDNIDAMIDAMLNSSKSATKYYSEEFDRYFEVNQAIKEIERSLSRLEEVQEHVFGDELINNLDKVNNKLAEQKATYEELYRMQKEESSEIRSRLENQGVKFDTETGKITNYDEITHQKFAGQGADDEAYEKFKNDLARYLELDEAAEDTQDKITEFTRKMRENTLKIWDTEIQIKIDKSQAERDLNQFNHDINESFKEVYKNYDDELQYHAKQLNTYENSLLAKSEKVANIRWELNELEQGRESKMFNSASEAQEALNEAIKDFQDEQLSAKQELVDTWETYISSIDQAKDKLEELNDEYDRMNDELEHQNKLMELIYGPDAYNEMLPIYQTQVDVSLSRLGTLKSEADGWFDLYNKAVKQNGENSEDAMKYLENYREATSALHAEEEAYLEKIQQLYKATISSIVDEAKKAATGGVDLDWAKTQWDDTQRKNDGVFDGVERVYQLNSLQSKWNDLISDTTGLKNQQKLRDVMAKQFEYLEGKTELTEYDIGLAEKELEVEKARIALEEAQNAKNSMKLVRNAEGNWSYQYVADEDNVSKKQQDYMDKLNDRYEYVKKANADALEAILDLESEYWDRYQEIMEDTSLSEKERFDKTEYLYNLYYGDNGLLTQKYRLANQTEQDLNKATYDSLWGYYTTNENSYNRMTEAEKGFIDGLKNHTLDTEDKILAYCEDINNKNQENWQSTAKNMADAWDGNEDSIKARVIKAMEKCDEAWRTYCTSIEVGSAKAGEDLKTPQKAIEEIGKKVGEVEDATTKLIQDTTGQLKTYGENIGELETFWKNVKTQVNLNAIAMSEYKREVEKATAQFNLLAEAAYKASVSTTKGLNNTEFVGGKATKENISYGSGYIFGNDADDDDFNDQLYAGLQIKSDMGVTLDTGDFKIDFVDSNGKSITPDVQELANQIQQRIQKDAEKKKVDISSITHDDYVKYAELMSSGYSTQQQLVGYDGLKKLLGYDTGGYTGAWDSSGKLAVLHQKELVLNQEDTKNMLNAVEAVRGITSSIGSSLLADLAKWASGIAGLSPAAIGSSNTVDNSSASNVFNITAEFPNANDVNEIREAILSLPNLMSQYNNLKTV